MVKPSKKYAPKDLISIFSTFLFTTNRIMSRVMPDARALICVSCTGSKYAWLNNTLDITLNVPQSAADVAINRYPINLLDKPCLLLKNYLLFDIKSKKSAHEKINNEKRVHPLFSCFYVQNNRVAISVCTLLPSNFACNFAPLYLPTKIFW